MAVRVALVLQYASGYGARAALGIRRFAHERPAWELRVWEPALDHVEEIARWRPQGILGHLGDRHLARRIAALRRPAVNVSLRVDRSPFPLVTVDNRAVGAAAARHLLELEGRSFAVIGGEATPYARLRQEGFLETLRRSGAGGEAVREGASGRWLKSIRKPAGLFACRDLLGYHVARHCSEAGYFVPGEVAILAAENEEEAGLLARPPLSTVLIPAERVGFEAAALLHRLLRGCRRPSSPLLIQPPPVIERESTGHRPGMDPSVAAACDYIDRHASEGVGVDQVAVAVHTGRRTLERRFRSVMGRTLGEALRRTRALPIRRLLAETTLTLEEIAERTGFHSAQHLSEFFRDLEGCSPGSFRRRHSP
jgi:LacI family transcriptional regulator